MTKGDGKEHIGAELFHAVINRELGGGKVDIASIIDGLPPIDTTAYSDEDIMDAQKPAMETEKQ